MPHATYIEQALVNTGVCYASPVDSLSYLLYLAQQSGENLASLVGSPNASEQDFDAEYSALIDIWEMANKVRKSPANKLWKIEQTDMAMSGICISETEDE